MKTYILAAFLLVLCACGSSASGGADIQNPKDSITINRREVIFSYSKETYDFDETTDHHFFTENTFFVDAIALLVIDAWSTSFHEAFDAKAAANVKDYLAPFVDRMRNRGIQIIHACYSKELYGNALTEHPQDIILPESTTPDDLYLLLQSKGIHTLMVAGYALNYCVLQRPVGLWKLAYAGQIDKIILIRDCTVAKEISETIAYDGAYHTIINMVEMWQRGGTAISSEIF